MQITGTTLAILTLIVAAGLSSGITFAFSNFIMAGLDRLSAPQAIRAMQHINETVLNPVFLVVFMVTGLAAAVLAGVDAVQHGRPNPWLVAGALAYLFGVVGVTAAGNVPLNDALALVDGARDPDAWRRFSEPWLRFNHVRWVAASAMVATWTMALAS